MGLRMRRVFAATMLVGWALSTPAQQQKPVGYVPTASATVSGEMVVTGGKAALSGSNVVTALDHTAVVTLARGGSVNVCQTSSLHVTGSGGSDGLLLSLDRGALELHMAASASDVLMTPDLRFAMVSAGPLDLRVRVTLNGDTCVENKGRKAPALKISDAFGEASYELKAGQHVMFEHGSLKEVVDREAVPCGCPPPEPAGVSIADAALSGKHVSPKLAAKQHPFPAAVSEGLAEPSPLPAQKPGETHTQVSDSLGYDGTVPVAPTALESGTGMANDPVGQSAQAQEQKGVFHAVGRFFRHLFGRQ